MRPTPAHLRHLRGESTEHSDREDLAPGTTTSAPTSVQQWGGKCTTKGSTCGIGVASLFKSLRERKNFKMRTQTSARRELRHLKQTTSWGRRRRLRQTQICARLPMHVPNCVLEYSHARSHVCVERYKMELGHTRLSTRTTCRRTQINVE